jgi:8-oxo-dGTP diphosphatase
MDSPPHVRTVVAAAIVSDGRVLAARRTEPAALAGGWELPGGKVEPTETIAEACVREIREELGCTIEPIGMLDGEQRMRADLVLRVVVARIAEDEPDLVPHEHDALRWLGPEELAELAWLEADQPFLPQLCQMLLDGSPLPGGNVGGAVRIGETVRRPTGAWTPAVHALLDHLDSRGLDCIPRVLGVDARGRDVLTYLHGTVNYTPKRRLDDEQLASLMRWLRRFHEAVADFRPTGEVPWRFARGSLTPGRIVTHNDVGWYNLVFTGSVLTGVFDWDLAGPGLPLDDLAFAAWNDVPLLEPPPDAARRLRLMAAAYGDVDPMLILRHVRPRIRGSARRIEQGERSGDPGMVRLVATGVLDRIRRGLVELAARQPQIEAELR